MTTVLRALWVAPIEASLIRDGAVAFEKGQILRVGPEDAVGEEFPQAQVADAGDSIVLPGLVNAHTHLELSGRDQIPVPADGFLGWLKQVILGGAVPESELPAKMRLAISSGIAQCLRFGVTTVGDITRYCQLTRPLLRESPLRIVSFGEVQGMGQRRGALEQRLAAALDDSCKTERLRIGISPHAPYSIEDSGYRKCLEAAREGNLPLATHLAESADEAAFLAEHAGPFRELWRMLGWWDEQVPRFAGGPIRFAQSLGLLDYPTVLAHVNYCDDDELAMLAAGKASIIYNPRTHAHFGHPRHRWREMLAAGINVAMGTDSCASSPDLNVVDELRLLHRIDPTAPAALLWEMATIRAARALGMGEVVGSLRAGKAADFVAFPASGLWPLSSILESDVRPSGVWIGGERVHG